MGSVSGKEVDGIPERRLVAAENIVLQEEEQYGGRAGKGGIGDQEGSIERSTVLAQDGSQYQLLHVGERHMAGESVLELDSCPPSGTGEVPTKIPHEADMSSSRVSGKGRHKEGRGDKKRNGDGSVKSVKVRSELR